MDELPNGSQLFLSDARGIYIPRDFAEAIRRDCVAGVSAEDWETLAAGPEHDLYWDTWADVERDAIVTDPADGTRYALFQDGDLWLVPCDERGAWLCDDADDDAEGEL